MTEPVYCWQILVVAKNYLTDMTNTIYDTENSMICFIIRNIYLCVVFIRTLFQYTPLRRSQLGKMRNVQSKGVYSDVER